jgi:predicted RNase H-like HicB family nuclease
MSLTAVYMKVDDAYIAFVEEIPGANTQGATLEEARENLQEAIEMVLEANRTLAEESLRGRDAITASQRDQGTTGVENLPRS